MITRRRFLKVAAGTGVLTAGSAAYGAASAAQEDVKQQ